MRRKTGKSPASRPISVVPAPNSHTSSSIHVGTSDSARSWPRSARNRVTTAPQPRDRDARQPRKGGRQARIEERHRHQHGLRRDPQPDQRAHEAVPGAQPQEDVQEHQQARRHRGLGRRPVLRVLLGPDAEQLLPEAEIDAQVGQHAPGEDGGRREDGLVVGGEYGGQEDRQQAGDAQHDAVEQLAVPVALLVVERAPQVDAREAIRRQLGDVGDRLAGLQREAEHVRAVAAHALGGVAQRMRDLLDAPRVEVGPHDAGAGGVVAVDREPALDLLVGGIAQGEREPGRVGAGRWPRSVSRA